MNLFINFARAAAVAAVLAIGGPILFDGPIVGSVAAHAEVVSRIAVKGNKRVASDTIANYITIKIGKSFGPGDVDASVKRLYGTNLFSDVKITPTRRHAGHCRGRESGREPGALRGQ